MKYIGNVQAEANAEVFATASGTLPDGKPVIVNSDGTVSVVSSSTITESIGSETEFESGTNNHNTVAYDTANDKIVIAYQDASNSDYGTAVVGTVSGTSISFGTPVVFVSAQTIRPSLTFDTSAGKVLIVYAESSSTGSAFVGTVSGTSISFGSKGQFESGQVTYIASVYDSSNNKHVVAYRDSNNSNYGTGVVGTISGTTVSFGSSAVFNSGTTTLYENCITYDTVAEKVVIAYKDDSNGDAGTCIVGTVSGTGISFGSESVFDSGNVEPFAITYDISANKSVIFFQDITNSNVGKAIVGTVSGTSISYGSAVQFESGAVSADSLNAVYHVDGKFHVALYKDDGNSSRGTFAVGTVSGTSISFATPVVFESDTTGTDQIGVAYDTDTKNIVIAYLRSTGKARVIQNAFTSTNLTTENFLGFSTGFASPAVAGSATTFETGKTDTTDIAYIGSNKVVIAYRQHYAAGGGGQTQDGYCVVGTISGTGISFGTPVIFSNGTGVAQVTYIENNKVVVAYEDDDNSSYSTVRVGTVSGTSISFGTAVVMNSANSAFENAVGIGTDKFVGTYRDDGNSDQGTARVGTVSGTSISFGSEVVFNAGGTDGGVAAFIGSDKIVIAYKDVGNSGHGTAIVGTVSGTSISFGSEVVYEAATTGNIDTGIAFIGNDKVVISYQDEGNSNYGTAIVGTVSGTSISFGTAVVYEANAASINDAASIGNNKVVIAYSQGTETGQGSGKYVVGTVSGTSITFDTAVTFNSAASWDMAVASPEDDKVAISWGQHYDTSGDRLGQALVTTIEDRGSLASGKTATIQVGGAISTIQGGLTAGQQYFVQTDGTLGLTAATPSVIAGTAVSATDLIVKG